jgi:hypothetical protein
MEEYSDAMGEGDPISKTSKINAAALINLILADLWRDSYRHSRTGEFSKWNADLNCLWIELGGDVEDNGDEVKQFEIIESELAQIGSLVKKKADGFKEADNDELIKAAKQYRLLMKKALFLKRLQNKQGKGTAYKDESDYYMD